MNVLTILIIYTVTVIFSISISQNFLRNVLIILIIFINPTKYRKTQNIIFLLSDPGLLEGRIQIYIHIVMMLVW